MYSVTCGDGTGSASICALANASLALPSYPLFASCIAQASAATSRFSVLLLSRYIVIVIGFASFHLVHSDLSNARSSNIVAFVKKQGLRGSLFGAYRCTLLLRIEHRTAGRQLWWRAGRSSRALRQKLLE